jgi:hypothetical protein
MISYDERLTDAAQRNGISVRAHSRFGPHAATAACSFAMARPVPETSLGGDTPDY